MVANLSPHALRPMMPILPPMPPNTPQPATDEIGIEKRMIRLRELMQPRYAVPLEPERLSRVQVVVNGDSCELKMLLDWRVNAGRNLVLVGPTGCGKTRIAWAVLRNIARTRMVQAVSENELALRVADHAMHGSVHTYLSPFCAASVLFLDDLGKAPPTERLVASLNHVFEQRYGRMLPTIVTTQLSAGDLRERLCRREEHGSGASSILRRLSEDADIVHFSIHL